MTRVGSTTIVRDLGAATELAPEWTALARREGRSPFSLPSVALAWWRHLGRGELAVVVVRGRDDRLLAVAPLHVRRVGPARVARWLGTGLGSVGEIVAAPDESAACNAVWDALDDAGVALDLVEYRDDGRGLLELRRRDAGRALTISVRDLCPVVELGSDGAVDGLLAARSNLRKKLARYHRAVEATGESLRLDVVTDRDALAGALPEVEALYRAAEAVQPRQLLLEPPWRPFLLDALDAAADEGELALFLLRLGNELVAFDLAFLVGRTLADWVGRVAPEHTDLSPGHLMLERVLRWAEQHDVEVVDLLLGDDEYKRRWSTTTYDTLDVVHADRSERVLLGARRLASAARQARRRPAGPSSEDDPATR